MRTQVIHRCGICRAGYDSVIDAMRCEKQGTPYAELPRGTTFEVDIYIDYFKDKLQQ